MPAAIEVVQSCRQRYGRLAVGSSAPLANIDLVLEEMGLRMGLVVSRYAEIFKA